MIAIIILITSVLANVILGLFVFQRNSRSITSRIFATLTFALAGWSIVSYLSVSNTHFDQLFLVRLTMFFVILMNTAFFFLVQVFPLSDFKFNKRLKLFALFCAISLVVAISPFLFTELKFDDAGNYSPIPGPGIIFFMLHVLASVIGAPVYLAIRYSKSRGMQRMQLKFFLFAAILMFTLLPVTNFVLPLAFGFSKLILVSPLYTAVFSFLIAYAIIKHKLFDIKTVVARSVAYIMLISTLVGIYIFIVFFISNQLFDGNSTLVEQLVPLGAALFLVMTAPFFKVLFDRFTNRIFYRDSYDPQEFLDELNNSIVSNIEIGILLRHSTSVIQANLKSEYCGIIIPSQDDQTFRAVGVEDGRLRASELKVLGDRVKKHDGKIITYEELDEYGAELKIIFDKYNIAILSHLSTLSYGERQTIAYILLGPKISGNIYSSQDIKIVDLISDELVIAIQNALRFEEIQEFNVTLQQKVNEATSKLKRTNEKLKAMDETKDEFISMASHQLRTPLTSVKGYLSMVLEGDAGDVNENQRKLLDQAFVSSQRMVYLISDLLNVSRLRTGKFIIDSHPANLSEIVEGEVAQLKEQANSRNQELVFDKPDDFPSLMLDETKIRQVIMNFVDNAMFYTPSGGKIKVELSMDKNHVYFMVKDNGIGVPKEEQKHMFTKFYRAKNARNIRPDGTGLGLFMAKKVIVAQGGNVLFDSAEGKGSTFGFSFNKKHLALPENT